MGELEGILITSDTESDVAFRELIIAHTKVQGPVDRFTLEMLIKFTRAVDYIIRKHHHLVDDDFVNIAYTTFLYNQIGFRETTDESCKSHHQQVRS